MLDPGVGWGRAVLSVLYTVKSVEHNKYLQQIIFFEKCCTLQFYIKFFANSAITRACPTPPDMKQSVISIWVLPHFFVSGNNTTCIGNGWSVTTVYIVVVGYTCTPDYVHRGCVKQKLYVPKNLSCLRVSCIVHIIDPPLKRLLSCFGHWI